MLLAIYLPSLVLIGIVQADELAPAFERLAVSVLSDDLPPVQSLTCGPLSCVCSPRALSRPAAFATFLRYGYLQPCRPVPLFGRQRMRPEPDSYAYRLEIRHKLIRDGHGTR